MSKENLIFPRLVIFNDFGSVSIPRSPIKNSKSQTSPRSFLDKFFTLMLPLEKDNLMCALFDKIENQLVPLGGQQRVVAVIVVSRA